MPKFDLECKYCGYRWQANFWSREYLKNITCPNGKCNDKNIKAREIAEDGSRDTYGYEVKPAKLGSEYKY